MIKEVYLFTNRNTIVFDEKGEQVIDIQCSIGWKVDWYSQKLETNAKKEEIQRGVDE
jgi:hypothetical protein